MTTPVLEVRELAKSFGGVRATRNVSFHVLPGQVHAIIGPNGAGKTTLMAQIFGELQSDAGQVLFEGRDLAGLAPERRARLGMARSFQITTLAPELTAREHVMLSLAALQGHAFRFFAPVMADRLLTEEADRLLAAHRLAERAAVPVSDLSHGEQRVLEQVTALAMEPRLLLLDEPMAGLGPGEGQAFIETLAALKGRLAILLVEHDMDAVFALADWITVLVEGAVAAQGRPEDIRGDPEVRRVYLQED